jgi:copper resistance protein C
MRITSSFPKCLLLTAIFSTILLVPRFASAHAVLLASTPAAHATVNGSKFTAHLKFNSRIDGAHSRLYLVDAAGKVQTLTLTPQDTPDTLKAESIKVSAGTYTLRWQALASDGHITRGEIPFVVQ